jgi:hypothetical protein
MKWNVLINKISVVCVALKAINSRDTGLYESINIMICSY